ncbi:MlaD family protein [Conexibacter sp. SYSU D00693]|uniref:MlaD family protein n=1 Tax=Conexibacter sp. SYSU D00693 TaxID=2812560 RepID=UPI00196B1000|nr:MlaD family protein [Conexibacter sp. SYSU D00693]
MERQGLVRVVAIAALVVVLLIAGAVVLLGGSSYRVTATLENTSQLVKGNLVTVAGERVGTVADIRLSDDGRGLVDLDIDGDVAPLRQGTRAVVKIRSLSGVANRVVELQLGDGKNPDLGDGATIPMTDTESSVEIDQLFNTFDTKTREGTQKAIRFFRDLNRGNEDDARQALRYLDPALAASSRLFAELNSGNGRDMDRFVTETSKLVTDLSAKDDDLAGLVQDLGTTMSALASRRTELSDAITTLPAFMRRTNTTFVNLRAALDDLDPTVRAARPVVRDDLRPLFDQLRPLARDAQPTVRDLSRTIRRTGADNDLVELLRRQPAIDRVANQTAQRNGAQRPGAFKASQEASKGATPQIAYFRPFSNDLVGWFDDFSHSGQYDALGSFSRAGLTANQFTITPLLDAILPVPPSLRDELELGTVATGRNNRCPGSIERPAADGTNPYVPENIDCDRNQAPVGP